MWKKRERVKCSSKYFPRVFIEGFSTCKDLAVYLRDKLIKIIRIRSIDPVSAHAHIKSTFVIKSA